LAQLTLSLVRDVKSPNGYSGAMFMVEEEQGAYGYVLLTNTNEVAKRDWPWKFAIQTNIQDLILSEAYVMYQDSLDE
jgi:hypothetical protein